MAIRKLKEETHNIIRTDWRLRSKIGEYFDIGEQSVKIASKRGSQKLNDFNVLQIIMKHTGKTEEELTEPIECETTKT